MAKLPKQAKRVFKGEIFEVYQWPQEMYDGSTETFEMLKRPDTVVMVAVTPEGKVVMVDEEQPTQRRGRGLPSGRVDPGEEPLEAAKRELTEETGYTAERWELWRSYQPVHKIEWTIWQFVARGATKTTEQQLGSGEKITVHDASASELLDMIARGELGSNQFTTNIMRDLLAGKRTEIEGFLSGADGSAKS